MMLKLRKHALSITLIALLVFSLGLAGCGGGGSSTAPAPAATPSPSPAPAPAPAQAPAPAPAANATLWEKIQEVGVIRVGNSPDYPPFEFYDDAGNIAGFDIDLLGLICAELGITYEIEVFAFENIETAVRTGQVDIGMSCFSVTPERLQAFDFSIPYFSSGQAIAVHADSGISSLSDLEGLTITAGMGTSGMHAAEEYIAGAEVIGMDNYAMAFMQLINRGADATVADRPVAMNYAARHGLVLLDEMLSYEDKAILVAKGNEDLVAALNKAIQTLTDNGSIQELVELWLYED